jgi:hypothetical protein
MDSPTLQFAPLNQPPTPTAEQAQPAPSGLQFAPLDQPPAQPSAPPPAQPQPQDTGAWAGVKRNTVGAVQGIYHALTDPVTPEESEALRQKIQHHNNSDEVKNGVMPRIPEESAQNPSKTSLAYHRILDAPAAELLKKSKHETEVAQDLLKHHEYWKGGNLYLSGLADRGLSHVPVLGAVINGIAERGEGALIPAIKPTGEDIPVSDVPADRKDFTGAATDVGAIMALEHAPAIVKGTGKAVGKTAEAVSDVAGKAAEKISNMELRPEQLRLPEEPAKPVSAHVRVETPLDNATIRKSFDKKLSAEERDLLREYVGETIPAGGSVETTLMKAIKPVNETIVQQGLKLNELLQDAGQFDTTAADKIKNGINTLKSDLAGGTEETFGKAIDKELQRAQSIMQSTDPVDINNYIRDLDKRINSYNAPEEPIDSASSAADAARVTIRRILRDKINTEVAGTKPINDVLGKNLELRSSLRKKFGDVAHDSVEAETQHHSEFNKGKRYLDYETRKTQVERNIDIAKKVLGIVGTGIGVGAIGKEVAHLLE